MRLFRSCLVLAAAYSLVHCNGLGSLQAGAGAPRQDGGAIREDASGATNEPRTDSDETDPADRPQEVTGSFLTSVCLPAAAASGGKVLMGCAVRDSRSNTKAAQDVSISRVEVVTKGGGKFPAAIRPAPAASLWHVLFDLPESQMADIVKYWVSAQVDGQPLKFGESAALKGSDCAPTRITVTPEMPAVTMDLKTDLSGVGNGLKAQRLLTTFGQRVGETLRLVEAKGVSVIAPMGSEPSTRSMACPRGWKIHFLTAENVVINEAGTDLTTYSAATPVPQGADHAMLGFQETDPKSYNDNEGAFGTTFVGDPLATGGCVFTFETKANACL